jgi:cytochrome c5
MNRSGLIIAAVVALGMAMNVSASGEAAKKKPVEGTRGFVDEINRPPEPYTGPPRSGAQVYAYRCAGCHDRTTQGAPMPGDDVEWGLRARQGMDVLMKHVIEGYNEELMPPRGSCGNCSDAELKAAVLYILKTSGIEPPQSRAGARSADPGHPAP